jgi:hypothetical protein
MTPRQNGLALHYIKNLPDLFANMHATFKPGSRFVFSIEHPIFMAPRNPGSIRCRRQQELAAR